MTASTSESSPATTQEVFTHHFGAFAQGIDAIVSDYTERSVILLPDRILRGLGGVRGFIVGFLAEVQPGFWDAFKIRAQTVDGEIAYLVWDAKPFVTMATDTYLVRDGKILVQTFTPFAGARE